MQKSWREERSSTVPQRLFLDALTAQGPFAYLRETNREEDGSLAPATPFVLYGGAGFGGKSYGLRTATLELNGQLAKEGCPGQWGCLMTATYENLKDRHLDKLRKEMAHVGEIQRTGIQGLRFKFHDPALGGFYLRNADDPDKYRGGEWAWLLFDELTELIWRDYDLILYPLRSSTRLPFRPFGAASNPDGQGHGWVKRLWIERDFSDESELTLPENYVFIPAKATDNPAFDMTIKAKLMGNRDPMLVKARWEGSWDLNLGGRFPQFSRIVHGFDWADIEAFYGFEGQGWRDLISGDSDLTIFGSFDYGTSEDSAASYHLHAADYERRVWTFAELYMQGVFLDEQARRIEAFEREYDVKVARRYCDPALKGRDDTGISRWRKFADRGIQFMLGNNDRIDGWATLDAFLWYERGPGGEGMASPPQWRIHRNCVHLIRQLSSAPRDDMRMEDVSRKFRDDHALDDVRYFLHSHFRGKARSKQEPEMFSPKWWRNRRMEDRYAEQYHPGTDIVIR